MCDIKINMRLEKLAKKKRQILKEFILLYQSLPCLWNVKSKTYHYRDLRADAYNLMVKKLQLLQPGADRAAVVKKINCLRSNYRKEQKKIRESAKIGKHYKSKLWYYSLFNFLSKISPKENSVSKVTESGIVTLKIEDDESEPLVWKCEYEEESSPEMEEFNEIREESELSFSDTLALSEHSTHIDSFVNEVSSKQSSVPFPSGSQEDRHDIFGKNVAMKLRHMSSSNNKQRLLTEKIINEALFMGEMGLLKPEHCTMLKWG